MIQAKYDSLLVKKACTRKEMGEVAAKDVAKKINELLQTKPHINMIFAAAPSQNEFLESLAADETIDFSRINAFHMDEYVGLEKDAPQGFGNFLRDRFFSKVPLKSVSYINGLNPDVENECERYSLLLKQEPIDIVCMGIGENAHIAFNDPHVAFFNDEKDVKIVELDDVCRNQQVNDGCFKALEEVPKKAITLTIPTLVNVGYIFCIVPAKTKANAVSNSLTKEIDTKYPASILRTKDNAIMYVDSDSGQCIQ